MTARRPRFAVSERGSAPAEHTTLLGAMRDATARVLDGRRRVGIEDRFRGVVWRAGRARRRPPGLGPVLRGGRR